MGTEPPQRMPERCLLALELDLGVICSIFLSIVNSVKARSGSAL